MKNPYKSDNPSLPIRQNREFASALRVAASKVSCTEVERKAMLSLATKHDAEAERLEDLADIEAADKAMAEDGDNIPAEQVERELGLEEKTDD